MLKPSHNIHSPTKMYTKMFFGVIGNIIEKSKDNLPEWIKWVHRDLSDNHCLECLALDGCYFSKDNTPTHPHHPYCHCILSPISYLEVERNAEATSKYSKFDPYLFNTQGKYNHTKAELFNSWGYTVFDAKLLQNEIEKQALNKYLNGEYKLGKLDEHGQHINIKIEIPRKDTGEYVDFISGWMIRPNGVLTLNTPYGGK